MPLALGMRLGLGASAPFYWTLDTKGPLFLFSSSCLEFLVLVCPMKAKKIDDGQKELSMAFFSLEPSSCILFCGASNAPFGTPLNNKRRCGISDKALGGLRPKIKEGRSGFIKEKNDQYLLED